MIGVSAILAVIAAASGLWAAYKWYQSGQVRIDVGYHVPGHGGTTVVRDGVTVPRKSEPPDPAAMMGDQIIATWEAMQQAATFNRQAARWTAVSVAAAALSTLSGLGG